MVIQLQNIRGKSTEQNALLSKQSTVVRIIIKEMIVIMIESWIKDNFYVPQFGETYRGSCPKCKRYNTFTVSRDLSTRMKYIITSVDGDYESKSIRNFVDTQFLARDARELRNYIRKIQPSVDLSHEYEDQNGNILKIDIPVGIGFFWPDATI